MSISTRRHFIRQAGLISGALVAHPGFYWTKSPHPAKLLRVAVMGVASRGKALATAFAAAPDCEVTYICEVDKRYVQDALNVVKPHQERVPKVEKDIRKVLEDKDVDVVAIAAPDHWHAPAAIMALQAGKHVYVEKPCSHNPQEGEWLIQAAQKYGGKVQMGNQRRSWSQVQACLRDLHDGVIGRVYYANAWYVNNRPSIGHGKTISAPGELDFDLWQGPAPRRSYQDNLHPYNWHWFWHWGTGESLNNGTHFLDLMRWGLQVDYPSLVVSTGGRYHYQDDWETPDTQVISLDFPGGKSMTWESRSCNTMPIQGDGAGITFYGDGGSIVLGSGNGYTVYDNDRRPKEIKKVTESTSREANPDAQNTYGPGLKYDIGHVENFLTSIRENTPLASEIVGGQKSVLLCQLGNIAYRTKSALHIDPTNGHIINQPQAQALWGRDYEPGWAPKM